MHTRKSQRTAAAGKLTYSGQRCVGAKEIEAFPTQGMDKMSGAIRKDADVLHYEDRAAGSRYGFAVSRTVSSCRCWRRR